MNFSEAVKKAFEGEKVRMSNWVDWAYWYNNNGVLCWGCGAKSLVAQEYVDGDWEIAELFRECSWDEAIEALSKGCTVQTKRTLIEQEWEGVILWEKNEVLFENGAPVNVAVDRVWRVKDKNQET